MCLGGYAGKNMYNAGKNSALLSGDASEANRSQCREICRGDICEAGPELFQVVCAHRFA